MKTQLIDEKLSRTRSSIKFTQNNSADCDYVSYHKSANAYSSADGKLERQNICLNILDKFIVNTPGFTKTVHYIYRMNLMNSIEAYRHLIKDEFRNCLLNLQLFDDKKDNYKSLFITIYPQFSYKHPETRFSNVLKKIVVSKNYSSEIDLDYRLTVEDKK